MDTKGLLLYLPTPHLLSKLTAMFLFLLRFAFVSTTLVLVGLFCFILHSVHGSMRDLQAGAMRLAELSPGVSTLTQCAIPQLLSKTNASLNDWKNRLQTSLERQVAFLNTKLGMCDGLVPIAPQGTYYTMIQIQYNVLGMDDWEFATLLLEEENVIVLPGSAIGAPNNVFRISFHLPQRSLYEATNRLFNFCQRHASERRETMETLIDFAMI